MPREVTLRLGPFGKAALERLAQDNNGSSARALQAAALYYLGDRDSGRPAWRVPDVPSPEDDQDVLSVELDDETWTALSEEADGQGVTPDLLALHALLYFVADVDSGRLGDRLGEALDDSNSQDFQA
jgi:hypothetical protein